MGEVTLLTKFIGSTPPPLTWDTVLSLLIWVSKGSGWGGGRSFHLQGQFECHSHRSHYPK